MSYNLVGPSQPLSKPLLTQKIADELAPHLPERMQLRPDWKLKYSLEQNGASLRTFFNRAQPDPADHAQHGYVLVIRDSKQGLFGAYSSEPLRPSDGRYRGNDDCFLWKLGSAGQLIAYKYTGNNDFMMFSTNHFISFGGGDGHYGLWVDDSLEKGVSYPSLTYGNEVLSAQGPKFDILGVELWEV